MKPKARIAGEVVGSRGDRSLGPGRRSTILGGFIMLVAGALSLVTTRPPVPLPASVAEIEFSAQRAADVVGQLAASPRPVGSAGHREARLALVGRLVALGLETSTQQTTVVEKRPQGGMMVARVENVVARLPGTGTPGAVLLLAHYDTRPTTPGAGDDAAGVATILEALRAVKAGPGLARDVLVLITDAEELGLLGAKAFVREHSRAGEIEYVLNLEGRGNRGVSIMFETTDANLELVRTLARAAPFPFANSLSQEVYRRMPNSSDFSAFRETGAAGMNFAFIGNYAAYHTALDTARALDLGSLQQHGSNALALVRRLGGESGSSRSAETQAVYFPLPGWRLAVYTAGFARLAAVALLALACLVLIDSRRAGSWSAAGLGRGVLLVVGALLGGVLVAWLFWAVIELIAPWLASLPHGRPYRSLELAALLALGITACVAWLARLFETRGRALEVLAGVLVAWTLCAAVSAWTLPGASYLFVWPAAVPWIVWWLLARRQASIEQVVVASAVAAMPGVVLVVPAVRLFVEALTLSGAAAPAALFALVLTLWAPGLARIGGGLRLLAVAWAVALAGTGFVLALEARASVARPRVDSLLYVQEADASYWLSDDAEPDVWTERFLGSSPERVEAPSWLRSRRRMLRRETGSVALVPPRVELVVENRSRGRSLAFEIESKRDASVVRLHASSSAGLEHMAVDGQAVDLAPGAKSVDVLLLGPTAPSWRILVELDEDRPLEVEVVEQRFGIAEPTRALPRPPHLIARSSWSTDSTYVVRRLEL